MAHVVIVGPQALSMENLRGDLIRALSVLGHRVTAMSDPATPDRIERLQAMGARFCSFPIARSGLNPFQDLRTWWALRRAFRQLRPDVVLTYSVKPVIWSGLALAGQPHVRYVPMINGLGFAFQGTGLVRGGLRRLVATLYRRAMSRAPIVLFQNRDNMQTFLDHGIVSSDRCQIVSGSGVNCERFSAQPLPPGPPVFLLIARLLKDKGLREYAEAARMVKQRYPEAVFRLLGAEDPSPNAVPLTDVRRWERDGAIEYLPDVHDVRPFISACHVFVLPSYHEGLPRTVIEAMAMARPILTTDVPGCRETVRPAQNGFLVPRSDAAALAERMIWFLEHPGEWTAMGRESRRMAEQRFDARKINAEVMKVMGIISE